MSQIPSSVTSAEDSGFTLVEVVIGFAIASLAVAVLFQTFSGGLTGLNRASTKAAAVALAQSKLAEATAIGNASRLSDSGSVGRFQWSTVRWPHRSLPRAVWITATVSWPTGQTGKLQKVDLTTLLIR